MTTQHVIHVQGLKKSFNDLEVLRGVGPDVMRGQHLRPPRLELGGQDH